MSGFEVVGVVLGAIPLIISALEHYESGLGKWKTWRRYGDSLAEARDGLRMEFMWYDRCLRGVLVDFLSAPDLEEMMTASRSTRWKSQEIQEALAHKLGGDYEIFLLLTNKIKRHLKELEDALPSNQQSLRQRVKYTLTSNTIKSILDDIADCNQRLTAFLDRMERNDQLAQLKGNKTKSNPLMEASLEEINRYAGRLYRVLSNAWRNCARQAHCTTLLLEARVRTRRKRLDRDDHETATTFKMCFENPVINAWHVAEVKVLANNKSKVKFDIPLTSEESIAVALASLKIEQSLSDLQVIDDLCHILHSQHSSEPCFGFCLDLCGMLRGTYSPDQPVLQPLEAYITLEDIMAAKAQRWQKWRKWTAEEQHILAITLASSYLQLHHTAWMDESWSLKNIVFAKPTNESTRIDVRHPFIMKNICSMPDSKTRNASCTTETNTDGRSQDNKNILVLAKLLMEIRLDSQFEDFRSVEGVTDLQVLEQWMREEEGNLSFQLKDALAYCIGKSIIPGLDLGDLQARQDVMNSVVTPLLKELHMWQDGPEDD